MRIQLPPSSLFTAPVPQRLPQVTPDLPSGGPAPLTGSGDTRSFNDMVREATQQVNRLQLDADKAAEQISTGSIEDLHTGMIALQKASLALDLTVQVRNKAVESYQEIMRMQL